MAARDLSGVFLMNPANREFAEARAPYPFRETAGVASVMGTLARISLAAGAAAALVSFAIYFYQGQAHESLIASVKSVTASVSGCDGPGRFQNVRFHYAIGGVPYDQAAYGQLSTVIGGSGLTDACAAGSVKLNYLAGDPNRWSIAPLSPVTRDELRRGISSTYLVSGPLLLFIGGVFALTASVLRKQQARLERLRDRGVVLEAELIKAALDDGEGSPYNIRCEYRFHNPQGLGLTGKSGGFRAGVTKKDLPVAGTRLLVLYVDNELHEAL